MTRDEARQCADIIRRGMADVRQLLLDFYEREGWRVLGYDSWRECAMTEFGYNERYVYYLLDAAKVERNLCTIVQNPVPEGQLRPLTKLEPEMQREVWTKAVETAPEGKVTAKHVEQVVSEYSKGNKDGVGATKQPEPEPDGEDDLYTCTIRSFELGVFMERFKNTLKGRYSATKAAKEFDMTPSGGSRMLGRVPGSRKVPVTDESGEYWIEDDTPNVIALRLAYVVCQLAMGKHMTDEKISEETDLTLDSVRRHMNDLRYIYGVPVAKIDGKWCISRVHARDWPY